MKVKDVMAAGAKACMPETRLADAASLMWENDCGALPVVSVEDKVVGIITDRDICFGATTKDRAPSEIAVGEIIAEQVFACAPEEDIGEALKTMRREHVRRLPVVGAGGMKRRLEIARAFVGWPPIMLFDEPTSGLDPLNEGQVLDLVIRARDLRGISSLLVTKQLHQIPYLATHRAVEGAGGVEVREAAPSEAPDVRVLFLHKGEVAFFGTPDEFSANTTPAVTYMTRASAATRPPGTYVADPWGRRRRPNLALTHLTR